MTFLFYLYIICLKEGGNIKKNRAFSVFEIILSIFIFSLLLNIAFLKYKDFRELQAINEAKAKIVETFYLASSTSLKLNTRTKIKLDLTKKQIILKKNSTKTKTIKIVFQACISLTRATHPHHHRVGVCDTHTTTIIVWVCVVLGTLLSSHTTKK